MIRTWRVLFRHRTTRDLEVEVEVHASVGTISEMGMEAILMYGEEALRADGRDPQDYRMVRTRRMLRV